VLTKQNAVTYGRIEPDVPVGAEPPHAMMFSMSMHTRFSRSNDRPSGQVRSQAAPATHDTYLSWHVESENE
jgi:hypothetical protein